MSVSTSWLDVIPEALNCEDSLQDRRTAYPGFREIEAGNRDEIFFLQYSDRRQHRS
jgi:hypothetical protein